ncbi:hypothetical protein C8A00DRAFT_15933 [Chaetomidium leptoderma]|uniref:Uncharacterized protein n=1 Tax=Chaetomidium leptoderma TaxID=669021 RepID=A0AAN6VK94_9PEZI|nr:hypothetical protein C8A00DRAFT_15933 [Chaetomidium leptoderma]
MASTAATTASATNTSASFTSPRNDAVGHIINCSFTGCPAKIDGNRQVLCEAHLQQAFSKPDKTRGPVQANGARTAPAPTGTSSSPRRLINSTSTNPRKLLPETDKDRPIMRRKTAGNPPQFVPQQPTPKHSTPPSRGDSTMSPPSHQPLAPRPPVHSPPASPGPSQDGEPARKRQRLSSAAGHSSKPRVNGAVSSRPSTAESAPEKKPLESKSPQSHRRGSKHSSHRPGRVREMEGKTGSSGPSGSRPAFRPLVRTMPLQFSNLRFIDRPGDGNPGVLSEQSSSGVNGSAGNVPRRSSGASDISLDEGIKDYFTGKTGSSTSSDSRTRPFDSSCQPRRLSELPNGQSHKAPPDRRRSDTQRGGYGPFQANGISSSKPTPRRTHFPIRPAQVTKPQPVQLPKPKEIDISHFDSLIYAQPGASTPPSELDLTPITPQAPPPQAADTKEASPKDEPLYLDIDPRIHWPQSHSAAWHAAKQDEIQARGKKKANFGRAAQSLQKQQLAEKRQGAAVAFEDALPEKVLDNPAWVRALRRLRGLPCSSSSPSSSFFDQEEEGTSTNGSHGVYGNGVDGQQQQQQKRVRRPGGVVGKRVGNSGLVVVTGLTESQMGMPMKRLGGAE